MYYDSTLKIDIKNTLIEESDWFNNTSVIINFKKPICPVTYQMLTSQEKYPMFTIHTSEQKDILSLSELQ